MSWDFFSTLQKSNSRKKKKAVIVGLGVGLPILILASALSLLVVLWKRKKKKTNSEDSRSEDRDIFDSTIDNEFEEGSGPKRIPYSELAIATNNFAKENKLGEGGFGGVYRGVLRETNSYIAVKRVSQRSRQGIKEYASEVKIISQLRHRNLVQLLGWCHQRRELLLVYEFMPNRSLDTHLFREKPPNLSWRMRHKIALGLASAVLYLHQEWERCVVHRDIKSSNIMLDSNFNAKLGDFGLARLVDHEKGAQTTVLAGTLGYMAPESAVTGRASKESDVYSFGIVLLEIACGRRPIERFYPENQLVLVEWVWSLYGAGQLFDAADPKLEKEYDELEMVQLLVVGLWCVHPDSSRRPSIRQAIKVLNSEAPIPTLPPAMPIAMYSFPSMTGATTSTLYSAGFLTSNSSILTSLSGGSKS